MYSSKFQVNIQPFGRVAQAPSDEFSILQYMDHRVTEADMFAQFKETCRTERWEADSS